MNFWQKANLFRKRQFWSIIASVIALFTWWQEKVTIEENQSKLSDFFRMENQINLILIGNRILEVQINETIANKQLYGNDSTAFKNAFFTNIHNLINQENLCWFYFQVQANLDADKDVASVFNEEKARKDQELQDIINTKNFETIYKYNDKRTNDFSIEVIHGQKDTQRSLNEINSKLKQNLNLYFYSYLLAALFFTIGKIKNFRSVET